MSINRIKISVIVAVYNAEKYLKQCLDSIINQSLKEIEIICVNDGSTDSSLEILKKYSATDNRIHVINKANGGAGSARNVGINIARGEFLSFLDADDFFELSMLEKAYNAAIQNNADIVLYECDFYNNNENKFEKKDWTIKRKLLPVNNPFSLQDIGDGIFSFTIGWAWDKLFRRSLIFNNNIKFFEKNVLEDAHFTCLACALANKIYYLDEVLAHYRSNIATSLSKSIDFYIDDVSESVLSLKQNLIKNGVYEKVEKAYLNRVASACQNIFTRISTDKKERFYNNLKILFTEINLLNKAQDYYFEKNIAEFVRKILELSYKEYCIDVNFISANPSNIQLSVVIPVYNAEQFLTQCLQSVLTQPLYNLEVICIDDGSTDNSYSILLEYAKKDHRILAIHRENNNAGSARNYAMKFIHGKYVHFLDSDDWVVNDVYSDIFKILNKYTPDICVCWHKNFDNVTKEYSEVNSFELPYHGVDLVTFKVKYEYFLSTHVVPWNKIYRRDFLFSINAKFDEIICANDRTFYFYTVFNANKIVRFAEYLTIHRINNSVSLAGGGRKKHFDCHLYANNNILRYAEGFDPTIKQFIVNVNSGDIFRWLPESDRVTIASNYSAVIDFCKKAILPYGLETFRQRTWYANAKIALLRADILGKSNVIPIVYILKRGETQFADVSLISLIAKLSSKYFFDVYVFNDSLNYESVKRFEGHTGSNFRIKCIDVSKVVKKYINGANYSKYFVDCTRLLVPELLCFYDKVLCFDGNIVFNKDIAVLFNIDLGENSIGAVSQIVTIKEHSRIINQLKLRGDKYINPNIIIFDIGKYLSSDIKSRGLKYLNNIKNVTVSSDEILSTACRSNDVHVMLIDSAWNYQMRGNMFSEYMLSEGSKRYFKNARAKRYIINYDSMHKPWIEPENDEAIYFWKFAIHSEWYETIKQISIIRRMEFIFKNQINAMNYNTTVVNEKIEKLVNEKKVKINKKKSVINILLWPFKAVRRFIKCMKANGFRYTMVRLFRGRNAAIEYKLKNSK